MDVLSIYEVEDLFLILSVLIFSAQFIYQVSTIVDALLGYESGQIAKPIDGMVIDGVDLASYAVNFVNVTTFNACV